MHIGSVRSKSGVGDCNRKPIELRSSLGCYSHYYRRKLELSRSLLAGYEFGDPDDNAPHRPLNQPMSSVWKPVGNSSSTPASSGSIETSLGQIGWPARGFADNISLIQRIGLPVHVGKIPCSARREFDSGNGRVSGV